MLICVKFIHSNMCFLSFDHLLPKMIPINNSNNVGFCGKWDAPICKHEVDLESEFGKDHSSSDGVIV